MNFFCLTEIDSRKKPSQYKFDWDRIYEPLSAFLCLRDCRDTALVMCSPRCRAIFLDVAACLLDSALLKI